MSPSLFYKKVLVIPLRHDVSPCSYAVIKLPNGGPGKNGPSHQSNQPQPYLRCLPVLDWAPLAPLLLHPDSSPRSATTFLALQPFSRSRRSTPSTPALAQVGSIPGLASSLYAVTRYALLQPIARSTLLAVQSRHDRPTDRPSGDICNADGSTTVDTLLRRRSKILRFENPLALYTGLWCGSCLLSCPETNSHTRLAFLPLLPVPCPASPVPMNLSGIPSPLYSPCPRLGRPHSTHFP